MTVRPAARRLCAGAAVLTALVCLGWATPARADTATPTVAGVGEQTLTVPVGAEPDGTAVTLDATVFTPESGGQHPAVLLAHGFGGSKADLADQARDLTQRGYVVVTWSARGFGASGGRIHLDDPQYEVADARALVDLLAARPDVRLDSPGDPRVGVAGGSYGGALALMLGATDKRVDAVAASITWNDLADAFFPQHVTTNAVPTTPAQLVPTTTPGPFKQLWASTFFQSANAGAARAGTTPTSGNPVCGRFDPTVCRLFLAASDTGTPTPELLTLLKAHSPAVVLSGLTAPTYLVQGMSDSLFGIAQADATARALTAQGTPVAVRWMDGGHDGASTTAASDEESVRTWLGHYLSAPSSPTSSPASSPLPLPAFAYAAPVPRRQRTAPLLQTPSYAGASTTSTLPLQASGATSLLAPPGGQPAAITAIPGGAGLLASTLPTYSLAALPGQSAAFDTAPLATQTRIVGAPRVRLTVTSSAASSTLYLSFWTVTGGVATFPRRLVAPVTVPTTPGQPTTVDVALPAASWTVEAGSVIRVLVTATDSAYASPRTARADKVTLDGGLVLPAVAGTTLSAESDADTEAIGVAAATAALLLAMAVATLVRRRRRRAEPFRPDLADTPLVVANLVKTYADGHRAVDDVSWRAARGQVVGLLGPNGAGKTTTLRMVMGLIRPDSGSVHVLGQPIHSGAPVLASVGALIEGPGFLPHLTGLQNLHAYWAATGRPEADADYEAVLEVAALGGAVDRPVRSYSHGMKQRLGIAQAMLGMPDVLVLDEPTNGLDPPQIAAMRPILHRYASTGRTVVVSSHLLAEVELTCSHVVVMHAGRVVTRGTVAELIDSADTTVVLLGPGSDVGMLVRRLTAVDGITDIDVEEDPVEPKVVVTAALPRADVVRAVAETGVDIVGVSSRKHLEDVFLGVIADAQGAAAAGGEDGPRSLTDRLRQVRAR